jgi:indolepyruvate ferredoxin oxidoreductase beta subunit
MRRLRIFLTGVGGQGTLTATTLLAQVAMEQGLEVTSGEIHGMAQRGGVVESTVLLGGWLSPRIGIGEADALLGFEPLETLRALPYLAKGGLVVSSSDPIEPIGVSRGKERYPELDMIRGKVGGFADRAFFLPCRKIGQEAGAVQSGNMALLGAACASGLLPFGLEALLDGIKNNLKPTLVDVNLRAAEMGASAIAATF